jgi:hypothetical protein
VFTNFWQRKLSWREQSVRLSTRNSLQLSRVLKAVFAIGSPDGSRVLKLLKNKEVIR